MMMLLVELYNYSSDITLSYLVSYCVFQPVPGTASVRLTVTLLLNAQPVYTQAVYQGV